MFENDTRESKNGGDDCLNEKQSLLFRLGMRLREELKRAIVLEGRR